MGLIPLKNTHKLRFYIAEVIMNYQYSVAPVSTKHSLYRYPCIHKKSFMLNSTKVGIFIFISREIFMLS